MDVHFAKFRLIMFSKPYKIGQFADSMQTIIFLRDVLLENFFKDWWIIETEDNSLVYLKPAVTLIYPLFSPIDWDYKEVDYIDNCKK